MNVPDPAHFEHVRTWIFDLDKTLYPHETDLFSQIDVRMTTYVSELLNLPREDARKLQKDLYRDHGTTLRGLMDLYNIDPDDFLQKVHDIDYSWLKPNPELGEAVRALPGRKFIFTNGNRSHAEKAAAQLGVLDHFEDIFDIVAAGMVPKPARECYEAFVTRHGIAGPDAVMFEDLARNLRVPKALGMKTVLVVPRNLEEAYSEIWERDLGRDDDVDYVTDDLTLFLRSINGAV